MNVRFLLILLLLDDQWLRRYARARRAHSSTS